MSRPNVDQLDRDALDDLGLIPDSDHTEILIPTSRTAPVDPVFEHQAGADHTQLPAEKKG